MVQDKKQQSEQVIPKQTLRKEKKANKEHKAQREVDQRSPRPGARKRVRMDTRPSHLDRRR